MGLLKQHSLRSEQIKRCSEKLAHLRLTVQIHEKEKTQADRIHQWQEQNQYLKKLQCDFETQLFHCISLSAPDLLKINLTDTHLQVEDVPQNLSVGNKKISKENEVSNTGTHKCIKSYEETAVHRETNDMCKENVNIIYKSNSQENENLYNLDYTATDMCGIKTALLLLLKCIIQLKCCDKGTFLKNVSADVEKTFENISSLTDANKKIWREENENFVNNSKSRKHEWSKLKQSIEEFERAIKITKISSINQHKKCSGQNSEFLRASNTLKEKNKQPRDNGHDIKNIYEGRIDNCEYILYVLINQGIPLLNICSCYLNTFDKPLNDSVSELETMNEQYVNKIVFLSHKYIQKTFISSRKFDDDCSLSDIEHELLQEIISDVNTDINIISDTSNFCENDHTHDNNCLYELKLKNKYSDSNLLNIERSEASRATDLPSVNEQNVSSSDENMTSGELSLTEPNEDNEWKNIRKKLLGEYASDLLKEEARTAQQAACMKRKTHFLNISLRNSLKVLRASMVNLSTSKNLINLKDKSIKDESITQNLEDKCIGTTKTDKYCESDKNDIEKIRLLISMYNLNHINNFEPNKDKSLVQRFLIEFPAASPVVAKKILEVFSELKKTSEQVKSITSQNRQRRLRMVQMLQKKLIAERNRIIKMKNIRKEQYLQYKKCDDSRLRLQTQLLNAMKKLEQEKKDMCLLMGKLLKKKQKEDKKEFDRRQANRILINEVKLARDQKKLREKEIQEKLQEKKPTKLNQLQIARIKRRNALLYLRQEQQKLQIENKIRDEIFQRNRIMELAERLKPQILNDPLRLLQITECYMAHKDENNGNKKHESNKKYNRLDVFSVKNGYSQEQVMKDPRSRLATAFAEADLLHTKSALNALNCLHNTLFSHLNNNGQ